MKNTMKNAMKTKLNTTCVLALALVCLSGPTSLHAGEESVLSDVAKKTERPASAPKYSDVCFRYGWIRESLPKMFWKDSARGVEFPLISDAKKAIIGFHATRIDWFYPGYHTANPDVEHVTQLSKDFIAWCHARGMKVIGAINTNTSTKELGFKKAHFGRYVGDLNNPAFKEAMIAWGQQQIDAGIDGLVCDDIFKYSNEQKKVFAEEILDEIKALKPGFEIALNHGAFIEPRFVKAYGAEYHYSDNGFLPGPGRLWNASKAHRELKSAFLMHPNKNMSKTDRRRLLALAYGSGSHLIAPWDEYIHGKMKSGAAVPRLFAEPKEYADLYGFARALGQLGYLDGYEDAAVAGYDLKENRYGSNAPIALSPAKTKVSVFARAMPGNADAPIVIHLTHMGNPQPFQLKLRKQNFFGDRSVRYQLLNRVPYTKEAHETAIDSGDYSKLAGKIDLQAKDEGEYITLDIPAIHPWGVVIVAPAK